MCSLTLVVCAALTLEPPCRAQYSPNCERDGQPAACAITHLDGVSDAHVQRSQVVFADHTVFNLERDEHTCHTQGPRTTCRATLTVLPGGQPLPGLYHGAYYEGGYRHAYKAKGVSVVFTFLD